MKENHLHKSDLAKRLKEIDMTEPNAQIKVLQAKLWYEKRTNRELLETSNLCERFVLRLKSLKRFLTKEKTQDKFNTNDVAHSPKYN